MIHNYAKVENNDGLVRDLSTGAIINTSSADFQRYLTQKNAAAQRKNEIERQAQEINNIKTELSDIKQILLAMIENQSNKSN